MELDGATERVGDFEGNCDRVGVTVGTEVGKFEGEEDGLPDGP